jgi:hypothetical protein
MFAIAGQPRHNAPRYPVVKHLATTLYRFQALRDDGNKVSASKLEEDILPLTNRESVSVDFHHVPRQV